jgi:hypothetical protein
VGETVGRADFADELLCFGGERCIRKADEIHQEYPSTTFILNFCPINDWIASVKAWSDLSVRWRKPGCFDRIPGLIISEGGTDDQFHMDLPRWWCSHIKHVRAFVKQHPSHKLIELDLYDETRSAATMASLFNRKRSCWGHKNERKNNTKLTKKVNPGKYCSLDRYAMHMRPGMGFCLSFVSYGGAPRGFTALMVFSCPTYADSSK